ncbi:Hsp20/alpha crystallin family protein [Halospeciosus flavus]
MDRTFEQMERMMRCMQSRWGAPVATDENRLDHGSTDHGYEGSTPVGADTAEVALDWHAADDAYTLVADLPGFEKEELDLTVEEGVLRIDAEHVVETESTHRRRHVHEHVTLPDDALVDDDAVAATYRNGVLEVTIPRSSESSGTRIDVE